MFIKRLPRHREFKYNPRVYDPAKDEEEQVNRRRNASMRFRRSTRAADKAETLRNTGRKSSTLMGMLHTALQYITKRGSLPIKWVIMSGLVIFLMYILDQLSKV
ncbi:MAG: hypothetical protein ACRBF0_22220 [Calditrichia bacterium]